MRKLVLASALIMVAAMAPALADDCGRIDAARALLIRTPHVSTDQYTVRGRLFAGSTNIVVGGKRYYKLTGLFTSVNWEVEPWDQAKEEDYDRQTNAGTRTCHADGSETVDGVAADIIASRVEKPDGTVTQWRLWIARDTGLPLKQRAESDADHISDWTWQYEDVKAPDTTFHLN